MASSLIPPTVASKLQVSSEFFGMGYQIHGNKMISVSVVNIGMVGVERICCV